MNKKQRNRKETTQNQRNRLINRRYTSTIKTLLKLFFTQFKEKKIDEVETQKVQKLTSLSCQIASLLDKAVKKNVIHKRKSNRKKSLIAKLVYMKGLVIV